MAAAWKPEQNVPMKMFGKALRERARLLGLSDAEVARRSGLAERRYGNYVTGRTEPDFATLLRISQVLATTPDHLLGVGASTVASGEREALCAEFLSIAQTLSEADLRLALRQTRTILEHRRAEQDAEAGRD